MSAFRMGLVISDTRKTKTCNSTSKRRLINEENDRRDVERRTNGEQELQKYK
jgi:hypothetical protein